MDVVTVVGARPQFIKAAVVSAAFATSEISERLIDTGQHYDPQMSAAFFDELDIPRPTWSLAIGSGPHGRQTGLMLAAIEEVLSVERPAWVVVYGDTNSTLAGALAAAKLHIPIAHVEAGLRSFNRVMPEEVNRVLTDHVSSLLFAPSDTAIENLAREGIAVDGVVKVGDVMFDLSRAVGPAIDRCDVIERLGLTEQGFALVTIHRAENTDDPRRFGSIIRALVEVSESVPIVWPVHPRTREILAGWPSPLGGVRLVDPMPYVEMQRLLRGSVVVVTDSGGLQKEAFFHDRPCVTVRDETEWVELVELGWNTLVDPRDTSLISTVVLGAVGTRGRQASPYGSGDAARKIADSLLERG